jgi:hypothetical protein
LTPLICRLRLHKWKNYGEIVLITWKEPGFVPATTHKMQKLVHSERMCSRCGVKERRKFAENADGTKAAVGWEKIKDESQESASKGAQE